MRWILHAIYFRVGCLCRRAVLLPACHLSSLPFLLCSEAKAALPTNAGSDLRAALLQAWPPLCRFGSAEGGKPLSPHRPRKDTPLPLFPREGRSALCLSQASQAGLKPLSPEHGACLGTAEAVNGSAR